MKVHLYTDGGVRTGGLNGPTRGRSGRAAAGFVIYDKNRKVIRKGGMLFDDLTVSEVEYSAVIIGLYNARMLGATKVVLHCDSQLVINQINGKFACRAEHLKDYLREVYDEMAEFDSVKVQWVPREHNQPADYETRRLLDGV